jgi:hypothetical protein
MGGKKGASKMEEQIAVIKNEIQALSEGADMLECSSRQDYENLVRQEDTAVAMKKQVESYFNDDISKAYSLHKSLTAKRKELLDPIETFIKAAKRVMGEYLALEQRKAQEQAVALQKQAEEMGLDTSLVPQMDTSPQLGEGRALVQHWTFKVVDEALVPRQYLMLDTKAIGAVITALKDRANIPGIEAVMETSVRRTGRGV